DQQHQQNIDQRNDVDVGQNAATATTEGKAHESPRFAARRAGQAGTNANVFPRETTPAPSYSGFTSTTSSLWACKTSPATLKPGENTTSQPHCNSNAY